jgi:hypothetical protein
LSAASAEEFDRAVSVVAVASICWRGTTEGRQGLARVLVIEGKVSAAAAAIDCSLICQHQASVFGVRRALSSAWMTIGERVITYRQQATVERHRHE